MHKSLHVAINICIIYTFLNIYVIILDNHTFGGTDLIVQTITYTLGQS